MGVVASLLSTLSLFCQFNRDYSDSNVTLAIAMILTSFEILNFFSIRFRALFLKQVLQTQNRPISTIIVFVLNALLVQTLMCWGWTQSMNGNNQDMSGLFSLLLIVFWGIYVLRIASDLC